MLHMKVRVEFQLAGECCFFLEEEADQVEEIVILVDGHILKRISVILPGQDYLVVPEEEKPE